LTSRNDLEPSGELVGLRDHFALSLLLYIRMGKKKVNLIPYFRCHLRTNLGEIVRQS
jgi:hypothetical protein